MEKLQGDYKTQFGLLREYAEQLLKSNPGTTVTIDVEPSSCKAKSSTRQFRRIYICYGAFKKGFKIIGRDILGLDGCFMKGPYPGQILTAVGVDGNNGIYPVAFAVVESETTKTWTWFLEQLAVDLELPRTANFTFISDRQKGIIPAVSKVFPMAEHRYCIRHIHENMKANANWRNDKIKGLFWNAASATTVPWFDHAMQDIKMVDQKLHDWLKQIPVKHWSRCQFSGRPKCDILLNNICEVFNRQLIHARDKPIITSLECIREYLMKRNLVVHKLIAKTKGPLTPYATKALDEIKQEAAEYTVIFNSISKYQVNGPRDNKVVNLVEKSCTCRRWDLTGIPCKHAVACIWNLALHGKDDGVLEKWVDKAYWMQTWKDVYSHVIDPVDGQDLWTPSTCPTKLLPPKHHKQIGRPKKKRKKSAVEVTELTQQMESSGKMSRKGETVECSKCKRRGHNRRSCKGTDVE
ncbi:putative transcription factor interactor and regulator CCHC(Zn) family [Helianthus annuus]|nr:putative transcription factor interactor and regulator CCHC(Zn) family [Helianthus annuus]